MSTALKLGPADHGRPMTFDEFTAGDYKEGYRYELIHGRLYVSPAASQPHDWYTNYVYHRLHDYSRVRSDAINHVSFRARVFVPLEPQDEDDVTAPEPDVAAYRNFPRERQPDVDWRDVSPLIAVETMGGADAEKDLVRNADLFLRIPTIQQYWVFDIRKPRWPKLIVHRRVGDRWEITEYGPDDVYRTELLPGFSLPVRPGSPSSE